MILSLRPGFYWPSACGYACGTLERRRRRDGFRGLGAAAFWKIRCSALPLPSSGAFSQRAVPGGAVADATKSNVAVGPPLSPAGRERGWGREWGNPRLRTLPTPGGVTPFTPSAQQPQAPLRCRARSIAARITDFLWSKTAGSEMRECAARSVSFSWAWAALAAVWAALVLVRRAVAAA